MSAIGSVLMAVFSLQVVEVKSPRARVAPCFPLPSCFVLAGLSYFVPPICQFFICAFEAKTEGCQGERDRGRMNRVS